MRTVFADSLYYFALLNDRGPAHEKAIGFVRSFHGRMVTAGWILTELGDGLASPANRPAFGDFGNRARRSEHCRRWMQRGTAGGRR